jgi:hypothetical protein
MGRWQKVISSLTAAESITVFTAVAGTRWRLNYALIGVKNALATCSVSLYETDGGTTSGLVFGWVLTTQNQIFEFAPGRAGGMVGSCTSGRLAVNCAGGGPMYGIFIGENQ